MQNYNVDPSWMIPLFCRDNLYFKKIAHPQGSTLPHSNLHVAFEVCVKFCPNWMIPLSCRDNFVCQEAPPLPGASIFGALPLPQTLYDLILIQSYPLAKIGAERPKTVDLYL